MSLKADKDGHGSIVVLDREGSGLFIMGAGKKDNIVHPAFLVIGADNRPVVWLGTVGERLSGAMNFYGPGSTFVTIGATSDGGKIVVKNKTGEAVCALGVDEYGNGVVLAADRNGKGRTLKPGP